jgi:hypothetical protein
MLYREGANMRLDRLNAMEQYVLQNGTASLDDLANRFEVYTTQFAGILRNCSARAARSKRCTRVYACTTQVPCPCPYAPKGARGVT